MSQRCRLLRSWQALGAALGALLLSACAGPDYAGGPVGDEPYGVISPGSEVTVWQVDGYATEDRNFDVRVAPGLRTLRVRIEHPIESDSAKPYEYRQMTLSVEEGVHYLLDRRPGPYPPYEIVVRERR